MNVEMNADKNLYFKCSMYYMRKYFGLREIILLSLLLAIGLALFMTMNKKWSWVGVLYAVMMASSRLYLCVHYPSDILFGIIDGVIGAVGAYFIVKAIYKYLFKNADKKLIKFYFEFSILNIFKKKEKTETEE